MVRQFLGNLKGPQGPQGPQGESFDEENNILSYSEYVETSWSDAILEAFKNVDRVYFPEGEYNIDPITLPDGVSIIGSGPNTVFYTNDTGYDTFTIKGSYENEINIVEDVTPFTNEITLENVSGLNIGDDILVKSCLNSFSEENDEEWLLGSDSRVVPFGEHKFIIGIDGNTITLDSDLTFPNYPANNQQLVNPVSEHSTVCKVNFAQDVQIKDLTVKRNANGSVVRMDKAKDCVVDNVTHINDGYRSGYTQHTVISHSLNCEVRNSLYKLKQSAEIVNELDRRNVFKIICSVNSGFQNCVSYNATQSCDISVVNGGIPSQYCYFKDCKINSPTNTGITTHAGNFMTRITNNVIKGVRSGIGHRGKKGIISGNVLSGNLKTGVQINSYGIGLYTRSATDNIVTSNSVSNFNHGIMYIDDGVAIGRARFVNAIISNNNIGNCKVGVYIYRYHTGTVMTELMGITISNNMINLISESPDDVLYGIQVNQRGNGVFIKDNMIKAQPSLSVGVVVGAESDNIVVTGNTLYRLNRDMTVSTTVTNKRVENNLAVEVNQLDGGN